MASVKTAVVLGAYGLIGAACARALVQAGFRVIGVGRSEATARRILPQIDWRVLDLAEASGETLRKAVAGANVIVNAAGALQDGMMDDVVAIHETMVARLVAALDGKCVRLIQISAAGARADASTEFFRSKARGDGAVAASSLDWVVLRPTLVLARDSYGGTALLRAGAAFPVIGFDFFPDSRLQTVFIDDVAGAVVAASRGQIAAGTVADLTEPDSHRLGDLVGAIRNWLGLKTWRWRLRVPRLLVSTASKVADALGVLGWRSPLRSTAVQVLSEGISGDPAAWEQAGGTPCMGLRETLEAMPATTQDRWFARLYLLMPVVVSVLSVFWLASGLVGLVEFEWARRVLTERGMDPAPARLLVIGGAAIDITLGVLIAVRPFARRAAFGMAAVSLAYLIGGTVLAPDLWADPLGPLLKVVPALTMALLAAALLEDR